MLQLIGRRALIDEEEEIPISPTIILPRDSRRDRVRRGVIKLVSSRCDTAQVGQVAYFGKESGEIVRVEGRDYRILNEDEIMFVVGVPADHTPGI